MDDRRRTYGFRLSATDVAVLAGATVATWWLWPRFGSVTGIIPLAVGHFFLFCNVFRIHRTKELIWAAVCLVNVVAWAAWDDLWWPGILAVQTPLTIALIAWEMNKPWYHGVYAQRINGRLPDYLEGRL